MKRASSLGVLVRGRALRSASHWQAFAAVLALFAAVATSSSAQAPAGAGSSSSASSGSGGSSTPAPAATRAAPGAPRTVAPAPREAAPGALPAPREAAAGDALTALREAIRVRFSDEPTVDVVVASALARSGLDPGAAGRARARSRRAGLVPSLRSSVQRRRAVGTTAGQDAGSASSEQGRDDALVIDTQLTLDLGRAVYGADEVAWAREDRAVRDARRDLVAEVVELYYRRQRLIVEIELLELDDPERVLALVEVEGLLQVFTGISFARIIDATDRTHGSRATTTSAEIAGARRGADAAEGPVRR